jgi:hypothetical protein
MTRTALKLMISSTMVAALLSGAVLAGSKPAGAVTPSPSWYSYNPLPTLPNGAINGSMAYDGSTGQLLYFGGIGLGSSSSFSNETFVWTGNSWSEVSTSGPSGREYASMAYDAGTGQLLLFGGDAGLDNLDDTWAWTGTFWTQLITSGPNSRTGASLAWDAATSQMILFGGSHCDTFPIQQCYDYNDQWLWTGSNWSRMSPADSPPGREYAEMAYDPATAQMFLVGGSDPNSSSTNLSDMWAWTGSDWIEVLSSFPGATTTGAMVYDPDSSQFLEIGGFVPSGQIGDTEALSSSTYTWSSVSSGPFLSDDTGTAAAYDPDTRQLVDVDDAETALWGEPPVVNSSPASETVAPGQSFSFSSSAVGIPTPTVQWQVSKDGGQTWSNIAGATSDVYSGTAAATENGDRVAAVWTNSMGSVGSASATLTVETPPTIAGVPPSTAPQGSPYNFSFTLGGDPTPTTTVTSGQLPPGLTLSPSGTISGAPTVGGVFEATVTASNGIAPDATEFVTIDVPFAPTILGTPYATAAPGKPYSYSFPTLGGIPVPTTTVTSGSLPPGLTLVSNDTISGTPTTPGTYTATITASNGILPNSSDTITITVAKPVKCSTLTGSINGTITFSGCTPTSSTNTSLTGAASLDGTYSWEPSGQTTDLTLDATSTLAPGCPTGSSQLAVSGTVTGGTSTYVRVGDLVKFKMCMKQNGKLSLLTGTKATF